MHRNLTLHPYKLVFTMSVRILAMGTINFILAGVQLLIENGSYLRVAFINFGAISLGAINKNSRLKD